MFMFSMLKGPHADNNIVPEAVKQETCVFDISGKEACEEQLVQEPFQQQIVQGLPEQQMIVTTPMSAKEFL